EPEYVWGRQALDVDRPEGVLDIVRRFLEGDGDRMAYFVCGGEPPGSAARLRQDGPAASAGTHRPESKGLANEARPPIEAASGGAGGDGVPTAE
ncbi:MAG TPA: hypothetical protein VJ739_03865, partial [Gemmataceae bacterium]|nr:hypothetical protein [Gemmataceae bacterium]